MRLPSFMGYLPREVAQRQDLRSDHDPAVPLRLAAHPVNVTQGSIVAHEATLQAGAALQGWVPFQRVHGQGQGPEGLANHLCACAVREAGLQAADRG